MTGDDVKVLLLLLCLWRSAEVYFSRASVDGALSAQRARLSVEGTRSEEKVCVTLERSSWETELESGAFFLLQLSVRWWMRCPAAYLMPRPDRPRAEEKPLKTRRVLRWVRFSRGNLNVTGARAAPDFQRYATLRWMKTPDSISPVNYFIFRLNV